MVPMRTLGLIVCQQLLRRIHGALLRLHVFVEAHQIPIEVERRGDGGDHLLLELQVGNFQVVLLHVNVAVVDCFAVAVQQVLRNRKIQKTGGVGVQVEEAAVDVGMRAAVSTGQGKSVGPVLRVLPLIRARVRNQRGCAGNDGVTLRRRGMGEVHECGNCRIESRNRRSKLGYDTPTGTDACAARAIHTGRVQADAGEAHADGSRLHRRADAAQKTTAFGTTQNFTREQRTVALYFDVDVVFPEPARSRPARKGKDCRRAAAESRREVLPTFGGGTDRT